MDPHKLHYLVTNWYLMQPGNLRGAAISSDVKVQTSGSRKSTVEYQLDKKISIEHALNSLATTKGIVVSKEEQRQLNSELDYKFPVKESVMGKTVCYALRSPGDRKYEIHLQQREQFLETHKKNRAKLHQNLVMAVMLQSHRVGAPVHEENIWHFLQWECGFESNMQAERAYWEAIHRMCNFIVSSQEEKVDVPIGYMTTSQVIDYLAFENIPLSVSTFKRYVERGIVSRTQSGTLDNGKPIYVYNINEVLSRVKYALHLKDCGKDLDTISTLVQYQYGA